MKQVAERLLQGCVCRSIGIELWYFMIPKHCQDSPLRTKPGVWPLIKTKTKQFKEALFSRGGWEQEGTEKCLEEFFFTGVDSRVILKQQRDPLSALFYSFYLKKGSDLLLKYFVQRNTTQLAFKCKF